MNKISNRNDFITVLKTAFPKLTKEISNFRAASKAAEGGIKGFSAGLKALSTTAKATMGTMAALLAVLAIVKGIDWFLDTNNDSTEELLENRAEILSDLADIEDELDTVNSQLEELEARKLTITDSQDIETLNAQIELLEQRKKLLENKEKNNIAQDKFEASRTIESTHTADVYSGAIYGDAHSGKWGKVYAFLNGGVGNNGEDSQALGIYSAAGYIDYLDENLLKTVKSSKLDNVSDNLNEIYETYNSIVEDDNLIGTQAYDEAVLQLERINELLNQVYYRQSVEISLDSDFIKADKLTDYYNLVESEYEEAFNSLIQKSYELNEAITLDDVKEALGDDYEYLENNLSQQDKSIEDYITWINAAIAANLDFAKVTEETQNKLDMSKVANWFSKIDESVKDGTKSLEEISKEYQDWLDELDDSEKKIAYAIFLENDDAIHSLKDYQDKFNEIVNNPEQMRIYANRIYDDITLIKNGFESATQAKNAFQAAMEDVVEYDTNFNSYTDALNTLKEEIEKGTIYSKTYDISAKYVLGDDYALKYTADEVKEKVNGLLTTVYGQYEDAEGELSNTYGFGFLEQLAQTDLSDLNTTISKLPDGSYEFNLDPSEMGVIADRMDITEEGAWSCLEALKMIAKIDFFDQDSFDRWIQATQQDGTQLLTMNTKADGTEEFILDVDAMLERLKDLGLGIEDVQDHLDTFVANGGKLLYFSGTVDETCESLKSLGLATENAGTYNIDLTDLIEQLQILGKTDEEINEIVQRLNNSKNVKFTIDSSTDGVEETIATLKSKAEEAKQKSDELAEGLTEAGNKSLQNTTNSVEGLKDMTSSAKTEVVGLNEALNILSGKRVTAIVEVEKQVKESTNNSSSNNSKTGSPYINGASNLNGKNNKSYANGTKKHGKDLISEVKPEIHVHSKTGTWELVDHPQFTTVEPDDIVFDAKQTEQLLKNGSINTFGTAFINGTNGKAYDGGYTTGTVNWKPGSNNTGSSTKSSSSQSTSTSSSKSSSDNDNEPKVFDWIEVALSRIQRTIDNLSKKAESTFKKLSTRLKATNDEISNVNKEINLQQQAYNRYIKQANSVGLSSSLATKVRNGTIDINEYDSATQELISDYQEWYEKALDCSDAIADLHEELASLYEDNFNNVKDDYENQLSLYEHLTNTYESGIDLLDAKGYMASTKYYAAMQDVEKTNIAIRKKELADLEKQFSATMNSGEIEQYSEAWYGMQTEINGVKEAIAESEVNLAEFAKTMREIEWERFDYIQDRISQITQEADFLIDLMSSKELYDDKGQLNNEGMATMGLHGQNYNVYMAQADQYAEELLSINKQLAKDPYNTELIERREELLGLQQDSIIAAEEEKQAIVDMVEEGINRELESLKNLIDTYTDALDSAKDLYDYQKKIADKTSNIASLEKQYTSIYNDTSEEAKAKLQKLQVELADAKEDLEETEYEQYITDQKKLLDELYTEYESILNMRLDNVDALISDMINSINTNSDSINSTLKETAETVGYTMTENIQKIWDNSTNALNGTISQYGEDFSKKFTSVQNVLNSIQVLVSSMVKESDKQAQQTVSSTKTTTTPTKTTSSSSSSTSTKTTTSTSKTVTIGGQINAGSAKIYSTSFGGGSTKQYYANDPIYTVLDENNGYWKVRWHKLSSGVTGWFKKGDVKAYKTGGLVDYTGLAQLDGTPGKPELVLNSNDTKNFIELRDVLREMALQPLTINNSYNGATPSLSGIADISGKLESISKPIENTGNTFGDINIEIPIEHVDGYNDFVSQLQKDNKFVHMIQDITINRSMGGSRLAKNKYQWER